MISFATISQIYSEATNINACLNVDENEEIQWASYPSAQALSKSIVKPSSKESNNAQSSEKLSASKGSVFSYESKGEQSDFHDF